MTYRGHIKNGQIALDEPARLPEGAEVSVQVLARRGAKPTRHWSRRHVLQLPIEQRRQLLMRQSERLVEFYPSDIERTEWQGGDILE